MKEKEKSNSSHAKQSWICSIMAKIAERNLHKKRRIIHRTKIPPQR